jgi:hypothetical protein
LCHISETLPFGFDASVSSAGAPLSPGEKRQQSQSGSERPDGPWFRRSGGGQFFTIRCQVISNGIENRYFRTAVVFNIQAR